MEEKETKAPVATAMVPTSFNYFDEKQFETMQRVCKMFIASDLVPDIYKANEKVSPQKALGNCMIALDIAMRLGANPLAIMQNMVPIYGKPSWASQFLIATVNTCGRFKPLRFKIEKLGNLGMIEYDERFGGKLIRKSFDGRNVQDMSCYAYTTEKNSDVELRGATISLRMAIIEGWYTRSGSHWPLMPEQMLMYRAAAFWTRIYAPELSMGMRTIEENEDVIFVPFEDVTQQVAHTKAEEANKEEIDIEPEEDPVEQPEEQPVQEEQPAQEEQPQTKVDTETGEVIEESQPPTPPQPQKPKMLF